MTHEWNPRALSCLQFSIILVPIPRRLSGPLISERFRIPREKRNAYLQETAISIIKSLSHTGKKKGEIGAWVKGCWPAPEEITIFVQKIPLAVVAILWVIIQKLNETMEFAYLTSLRKWVHLFSAFRTLPPECQHALCNCCIGVR
jgi:hypothetical protein